ncbi:MAG TPA: CHAT domain-containing protein, partial [Blastocatellia bacterium]
SMGFVHCDQGDYDRAAELFQKSMQLSGEIKNDSLSAVALNGLGTVYTAQGDYAKAQDVLERALALHEKAGYKQKIITALCKLALLHSLQNHPKEALSFAERASALARETGLNESLWFALASKGQSLCALNRIDEGRKAMDESIGIIESLRAETAGSEVDRSSFFENKISVYHAIIELLIGQNKPGEALAYAERAKARVLLDTLQSGRAQIDKAMTDAEREEERASNNEIYSLNAQIQRETLRAQSNAARLADLDERLKKARLDQQAFLTRLYAAHPDLKVQRGETPAFTLAQASHLLDPQTALLEYVVTQDKTFLFLLTRQAGAPSLKVYQLPVGKKEVRAMAEGFRETLASHNLVFRPAAARLYQSLIKPAENDLRGKSKIIIVPDSALWELPFQALQTDRQHYLIEDAAIVYAPSLSVLAEMKKQREKRAAERRSSTLLAFANPALGDGADSATMLRGGALAPLPQTEMEAKTLAQVYGRARSKIYLGAEATEERFKAEAARFSRLHLATHGVLDDRSPMYSQIILSHADGREDGLLEAWEIMRLDLTTDLVVLSACETARGRISEGEGVIGLTWALFVAGSPSTLVSQWKVDASSTSELMLGFHRNLSARMTKAEALRKAVLKMLESSRYRHPFYWAAFVMTGDGF